MKSVSSLLASVQLFSYTKMVSNEAKTESRETQRSERKEGPWVSRMVWVQWHIPHDWISVVQDVNASLLV